MLKTKLWKMRYIPNFRDSGLRPNSNRPCQDENSEGLASDMALTVLEMGLVSVI